MTLLRPALLTLALVWGCVQPALATILVPIAVDPAGVGDWVWESGSPSFPFTEFYDDSDSNGWQDTTNPLTGAGATSFWTLGYLDGSEAKPIPAGSAIAAGNWTVRVRGARDSNRSALAIYTRYNGGTFNNTPAALPHNSVGDVSFTISDPSGTVVDASLVSVGFAHVFVSNGFFFVHIDEFEIETPELTVSTGPGVIPRFAAPYGGPYLDTPYYGSPD